MSEWTCKSVGLRIIELPKSVFPAGMAEDIGSYPFFCSSPVVKKINHWLHDGNTILMGTGGVATVHYGQNRFAYSTDTWAFTVADSATNISFLFRQFEHKLKQIEYFGFEGSGLKHLQKEYIRKLELLTPPLNEQNVVVKVLDTIDTAIQQTQAIINKLKQLKQGLLHDLLTRGVDAKGELRPCYEDAPHLYKESPLGWIPKDWEVCRVANLIVGIDAGKSPNCQDVPACGDQWGVLKVGAVHPDGLKLHENKVIEEEIFKKSNYLVRNGDLLFSRANTLDLVGFVCHVINSPKFLMLSDKTLRLTVKPSHMITRFLFWHFQHPEVRAQIEIGATGTSGSMKNISQSSIENILVCRPQINEQEKITQRLDNAVNNHKAEIENLLKMQSLKTALMDDLLTGRIRVTSLLQTEASSV
jgi:type I restriction enzyme S subunit